MAEGDRNLRALRKYLDKIFENFCCKGKQEMGWQLGEFMGFLRLDIIKHGVKNCF